MGRKEEQIKWCILRTAAPRTLLLAASLAEAGLAAWTPTQIVKRPGRGRDRHKVEQRPAPITPTFVFAHSVHALELAATARSPSNPHPAFSVLRYHDRIPLVRDQALEPLRHEEERLRIRHLKTRRKIIETGTRVNVSEGPFAGMTGIVERGDGKAAIVNFGAGFSVSIATYLFETGVVQALNKPGLGIAA